MNKLKKLSLFLLLLFASFLLDLKPASAAPVFVQIRPAFVKFATQPTPISPAYPDTCFNIAWWLQLVPSGSSYIARMTVWQAQENCHTAEAINVYTHDVWMQLTVAPGNTCAISTTGSPNTSLKVKSWDCPIGFPAAGRVVSVAIQGWAGSNTFNNPNYSAATYPFLLTP